MLELLIMLVRHFVLFLGNPGRRESITNKTDEWLDRRMDECVGRWMDRWIDG